MPRTNKKDLIIRAAKILFGRFGWNKTTVDEIARKARIGKGTIYHYFDSKEDIFAEVVEEENRFFREKIEKSIRQVDHPGDKLRSYMLTKMRYTSEMADIPGIGSKDEYLDYLPFMEVARKKNYEEEIRIVRQILELGVDMGVFRIEDFNLTTLVIVSFMKGLEISWNLEWVPSDLDREVEVFLHILLEGISVANHENSQVAADRPE